MILADAVTAWDVGSWAAIILAVGTAGAALGKAYSDSRTQGSRIRMDGNAQDHQQAKLNFEEAKAVYDKLCATFENRLVAVEADRAALVQEVRNANENRTKLIEEHAKCREETVRLNGKIETLDAKIELLEERLAKVDRHTENNKAHVEQLEATNKKLAQKVNLENGEQPPPH